MDISLRKATLNDLEDITNIAISVIPLQPSLLYLYPYFEEYPEDIYKYILGQHSDFINSPGVEAIVAEARLNNSTNFTTIAYATWDLLPFHNKCALR